MKLTEADLTCFIATAEFKAKQNQVWWDIVLDCLLELKQLRAEKRQREDDNGKA
jgi:hypothetical protein